MNNPCGTPDENHFTDRDFYDFLNGAGNHELKLLTGAVILSHSDMIYTGSSLRRTLLERQGEPAVWSFQVSAPVQYCEQSLGPIGAVITTEVPGKRGKNVTGYRANELHREQKLALIGSLLGWSLDYPDISLQNVFGTTASSTRVRAPEVRHQIYMSLLTGDEGGTVSSISQALEGLGYRYRPSINLQLMRMRELGLLEMGSSIGRNPSVKINYIEYEALSSKLRDTLPETQATYTVIKNMGAGQITSVNEIVSKALEINPTIDAILLRRKLLNGVNVKGFPGLAIVEETSQQRSTVTLSPKTAGPITDLCERLEDVKDGALTNNAHEAYRIIGNIPDFRRLVAKAKQFSHAVAGRDLGREVLENQLVDVICSVGPSTVATAREELMDRHGREISSHMLRVILNKMADEGRIQQGVLYGKKHSNKTTRIFKPTESE
jgi:hypothetical protein